MNRETRPSDVAIRIAAELRRQHPDIRPQPSRYDADALQLQPIDRETWHARKPQRRGSWVTR